MHPQNILGLDPAGYLFEETNENRVCNHISNKLKELGLLPKKDVMGNLWVSFPGEGPNIMLFTHMDQIGFVVRKIEKNGFIRIERLGGIPEKALASQAVIFPLENGQLNPLTIDLLSTMLAKQSPLQ